MEEPPADGEIAAAVIDLVDRGIIRILDLAFVAKREDGSVAAMSIDDVGNEVEELKAFEGASSSLLSGGQLVANGRIPVQALLAALDAAEEAASATTTS